MIYSNEPNWARRGEWTPLNRVERKTRINWTYVQSIILILACLGAIGFLGYWLYA